MVNVRIALIGAPGSGKTHISKIMAEELSIPHIETDTIFWQGGDLRAEVAIRIEASHWIIEGHMSKLSDLVFPRADKIIVIEGLNFFNLIRSLRRDWRRIGKAWFNLQNYEKLSSKRLEMVNSLLKERKDEVFFLNNFPKLNQSDLATFCKSLKSSPV